LGPVQRVLVGEPKWSESIVVLGRGVPNWSRRYRRLIYCIAGIGEVSGWLRLYPAPFEPRELIEKFDIIQVVIRKSKPEKHRPESRKIYIEPIRKVDRIEEEEVCKKFLQDRAESGNFLHDESWRVKSLGMIKPIRPEFWITKGRKLKVRYKCDTPSCGGHINEVTEFTAVNRVGRKRLPPLLELKDKIRQLEGRDLYFVMGTVSGHPHRWILVEIHDFKKREK